MKQKRFGFIVALVLLFVAQGLAQQYGILKPTHPGRKSDVIPLSKKQYENLIKNKTTFFNPYNKNLAVGIEDTIRYFGTSNSNFGVAVGDTLSSYYDPPVACQINAIGIIAQTWGSEPLAAGYKLFMSKAAHHWRFPRHLWDGDGCYTKDSLGYQTLLGEKMWGDASVPIVDSTRIWTKMNIFGQEPESRFDPFIVSVAPYGVGYMGTEGWNYGSSKSDDSPRLAKYCHEGRLEHEPQFVVRDYSCCWLILVEWFSFPPRPLIWLIGTYYSVFNSDPRPIRCEIFDRHPYYPERSGIVFANLIYQINGGEDKTIPMYLVSGDSTDGIWEGVLPAGYMNPGDLLEFHIEATDKDGRDGYGDGGSFSYFVKQSKILFYYNDYSFTLNNAKAYYWNQCNNYRFDTWDGTVDGPTIPYLLNQYDCIVRVDGNSPMNIDRDVFADWLISGTPSAKKYLFWSSQDFLGAEASYKDTMYAEDDWHNRYLGIAGVLPDLQYRTTGKWKDPLPVYAILGDTISGKLALFCVERDWQLLHNPVYEFRGGEWSDGLILNEEAIPCFKDSATGMPIGLHHRTAGTQTVFLALDQLALDINPPYENPNYVWPEYGYPDDARGLSVLKATLDWFSLEKVLLLKMKRY